MDPGPAHSLLAGRVLQGPESARILIDNRPLINFAGGTYLALQSMPELRAAGQRSIDAGGSWAQMSCNAYGGTDPFFAEFEIEGARFFGSETSVFLPTGYFCGLASIAALESTFDVIFIDELGHFSLYDAARLSGTPVNVFGHCDSDALQDAVRKQCSKGQRPLVLTDGVFATTGRIPPLAEYSRVALGAGGQLFVDESHGYGVVGDNGRGAAEYCGVTGAFHAGTLSKGFCAQGGILPCTRDFAVRVRSRPPVRGANGGSPVSVLVASAALRLTREFPERRERLHTLSKRLKIGLRGLGLDILDTPAPITSFRIGTKSDMLALQKSLFDEGIHVLHSTYIGAGPEGMIRCATFADHSDSDIDTLIAALRHRM